MDRLDSPRAPALAAALRLHHTLERAAAGRYLVEGASLVRQALAAGRLLEAFLLPEAGDLRGELAQAGIVCHELEPRLLPKLIGTNYETAVTAVGVVRRETLPALPGTGLLLACESIQDPRNVGVLVRTAEAAGAGAVAFSDDSADPFARGAVRSSTGSILRQPLHLCADLPQTLHQLRAAGVRVLATSAHAERSCWAADLRGDLVIVLGNESTGLSAAAYAVADELVSLPVHGQASSLNVTVAAGAILYEAQRQRSGTRGAQP